MQEKEQILQILKDVREDPKFTNFYGKFESLKEKAESIECLKEVPPEKDYGNMEYKLKLDNPTLNRVDHLTTQMRFRLNEGYGRAIYRIGVEDNGEVQGIKEHEI